MKNNALRQTDNALGTLVHVVERDKKVYLLTLEQKIERAEVELRGLLSDIAHRQKQLNQVTTSLIEAQKDLEAIDNLITPYEKPSVSGGHTAGVLIQNVDNKRTGTGQLYTATDSDGVQWCTVKQKAKNLGYAPSTVYGWKDRWQATISNPFANQLDAYLIRVDEPRPPKKK